MRFFVTTCLVAVSIGVALGQAHNAHWYNQESASGRFSAILNLPDGTEAIVAIAREKGIETTVAGIGQDLTFERKVRSCATGACWTPLILLGIDKDMDGKYEADNYMWQWTFDPKRLHGDTFIQCEAPATLLTPDATFQPVDAYATYACYSPNLAGTSYSAHYGPLVDYQFGLGAPDGIFPTSGVLALKVHAGGNNTFANYSALVDLVTMGGAVRIDEPNDSRAHFDIATSR
jgi:hypothetical protein